MTWGEWLLYLGINVPVAFAGMLGGLLKALITNRGDLFAAITSVVAGIVVANYLGSAIATQIAPWGLPREGAGFVTGLVAMWLVEKLFDKAKAWNPDQPQERKDA